MTKDLEMDIISSSYIDTPNYRYIYLAGVNPPCVKRISQDLMGTPASYGFEKWETVKVYDAPKHISLDNGHTYLTANEAINEIMERNLWDAVVMMMDDDLREALHDRLSPCTEHQFLAEYLRLADYDLVIG